MSEALKNSEVVAYLNRLEVIDTEISNYKSDFRDVLLEAKSKGYEPKMLRKALKVRKQGIQTYETEQEELELYLAASGLTINNEGSN
jgi:uncharacterized protein (UPF0335 family)